MNLAYSPNRESVGVSRTPIRAPRMDLGYGALCRGSLSGRMGADTTFDGDDLRRLDPQRT